MGGEQGRGALDGGGDADDRLPGVEVDADAGERLCLIRGGLACAGSEVPSDLTIFDFPPNANLTSAGIAM